MRQLKISKQITNREAASLDKYLLEIGRIELLTAEEEVKLAKLGKNGDHHAFNKLIRANLRFVVSVSKQYQNKGLTLPDLINEGNIGLIKAARRFDETKGFKFISYAVWWIRQSILQALAEQARIVRLPLNKIGSLNKINQAFIKLEQEFERTPTYKEISIEIGIKATTVKQIINNTSKHVSMDAPLTNDSDNNLYDILLSNDALNPEKKLLKESLNKEIDRILSSIPKREADMIKLYYGLEDKRALTLEEIGEKYDLTRERVRQIKGRVIKLLKKRSKILKSYL